MLEVVTRPAHLWVPESVGSAGAEAADLAASVGMHLDGEQRLVLDAILAEKADGTWAAFESAVIAPRQNLKTYAFQAVVLAHLFLFRARLLVWTAHLFPTTQEAFRDLRQVIDGSDHLRRRVKKVSEANGEEQIELMSGQRLLFRARSKTGGRGLSGDVVVLDEAFALKAAMMGSLLPTMSARPNPQLLYGSSAGMADSDVLRAVRDRGRDGGDPSLAYVEWCAPVRQCAAGERCDHRPGSVGCVLDDRELWRLANPAMGRRISEEHIAKERRAMPAEEFARERLGWWEEPTGAAAGMPSSLWTATGRKAARGQLLAVAVDATPDLAYAALSRAVAVPAGILLELVAHKRGTAWAAPAALKLRAGTEAPVVVDMGGPASTIGDDLVRAGLEPLAPTAREVAQACNGLIDGMTRRTVWHAHHEKLDDAAKGATRRPVGDSFAWSRRNSATDISPLVSINLALWGAGRPDTDGPSVYEERGLVRL